MIDKITRESYYACINARLLSFSEEREAPGSRHTANRADEKTGAAEGRADFSRSGEQCAVAEGA